jgi:hypothetical protein
MSSNVATMLRTPTGCVPPSKWELAGAKEIDRLRRALQRIADLPSPDKTTRPLRRTPKQIAIAALKHRPI